MSKERLEAIDEARHVISGIILQLLYGPGPPLSAKPEEHAGEMSKKIRAALVRIDAECAKLYDAGAGKTPANHTPKQQR